MNQNFSADQTIKLVKKSELIEHGLTKADLFKMLNDAFEQIIEGTYEFSIKKYKSLFSTNNLVDKLFLRKLNDNIKKLYKDKQANRRIIIYQIKTLLEDESPMWLYRTDSLFAIYFWFQFYTYRSLYNGLKGFTYLFEQI